MWAVFAIPYVWVVSGVLGIYQGSETIAQGFIVTYLLKARVRLHYSAFESIEILHLHRMPIQTLLVTSRVVSDKSLLA